MSKERKYSKNAIKVVELFAGVGGFRLGLENVTNGKKESLYKTVWANQWEPSTKVQHAANIYRTRFGSEHFSNQDISTVHISDIPNHELLVGGFPCQDYSVARTLNQAHGLIGKKGVLWWQICRIIYEKKKRPSYLLLENVDRLLKSPAKQRGRDFALMLASLAEMDYAVEWRVINAADYGFPQRRRRVFLLGYHKRTPLYKKLAKRQDFAEWISNEGVFAKAFPVVGGQSLIYTEYHLKGELPEISKEFNVNTPTKSIFENSGVMINKKWMTIKTDPLYFDERVFLRDILIPEDEVPNEFYINDQDLEKWRYLKGQKNEPRSTRSGHTYTYTEGGMVFPDALDKPSRTIVTGEGGSTPSRFKHVIRTKKGLRRLTPVELERLNMFPDDHTEGETDTKRAFFMGNALVVGVVEKIGEQLAKILFK
jgi:DNA (cytosine-5)-methyltransferase 1